MVKDFLGCVIEVGDVLIYPVRRGSDMWLSKIIVTDLGDGVVHGTNDKGRRVILKRPDRSVVGGAT